MRVYFALIVSGLLSSQSLAQQASLVQLRCDGYQEEQTSSDLEPNGRKTREARSFTLRVQPDTGFAQITGLLIFAVFAKDEPLRFSVTDTTLSYKDDVVLNEPKSQFKSFLSIDRYSGLATESQVITAEKAHVLRVFSGEYQCSPLRDKLF